MSTAVCMAVATGGKHGKCHWKIAGIHYTVFPVVGDQTGERGGRYEKGIPFFGWNAF